MSWQSLRSSQFIELLNGCASSYVPLGRSRADTITLFYRIIDNESLAVDPTKRRYLPSANMPTHVCTGVDGVTAFALGPFYLSPGDWLNVFGHFKLDPGGIISYSSDIVQNDMHSTISPSVIHMHHVHIKEPDDRSGHRFETHGDYYGIQGNGYAMTTPWGYCTVHDAPTWYAVSNARPKNIWPDAIRSSLLIDGLANVVTEDRLALWNQPLYFRIAFQTLDFKLCSKVDKLMLMPFMLGLHDPLTRFTVRTPYKIAYWWNGRFPRSGDVVSMWRHSHRQRDGGMLMYLGQWAPPISWVDIQTPSVAQIERSVYESYQLNPVARTRHDGAAQFEWNSTLSVKYGMHYTTIAVFNEARSTDSADPTQLHKSHTIIFMHYIPSKRRERLQYVDGGDGMILVDGTVHDSLDQRSFMNDASFCCRHWRLEWSNASARFEWNAQGTVAQGHQNCPVSLDSIHDSCVSNDT